MGDPRRLRKKYDVPRSLWEPERIAEEGALRKEYGLKNVKEIWIAKEVLRKIRRQARSMLGLGEKGKNEMDALAARVVKQGYTKSAALEDLLGLNIKTVLDRRLQSIVFRKGLARSMKQSRQLVTHGFIAIDGRKVSAPGYPVPVDQEEKISYYKPIELFAGEEKDKKLRASIEDIKDEPVESKGKAPEVG